ncbi:MAG: hypothetical protein RIF32_05980 [Leptospirales bacterium]|jgi:hypothetical protein
MAVSGTCELRADRIELKDGTILNDSVFLGIDRSGFALIQKADGQKISVPMSRIRSMIRADATTASNQARIQSDARESAASDKAAPKPPASVFLEPLRADPLQPIAGPPGWNDVARWLTPGLARYQAGDVPGGIALFAGFVLSLAATVLYYQSWQNIAAQSNTDLAYNLGDTGRLDAKFTAARRNTYLSGAVVAALTFLHLRDLRSLTGRESRSPSPIPGEQTGSNFGLQFSFKF